MSNWPLKCDQHDRTTQAEIWSILTWMLYNVIKPECHVTESVMTKCFSYLHLNGNICYEISAITHTISSQIGCKMCVVWHLCDHCLWCWSFWWNHNILWFICSKARKWLIIREMMDLLCCTSNNVELVMMYASWLTLVEVMSWILTGNKPLSEPILTNNWTLGNKVQ